MKNNKQLYIFLGKALGLYIVWELSYTYWISTKTSIDSGMTSTIASISSYLMRAWGYNAASIDTFEQGLFQYSEILINKTPQVLIANPCNGLALLALFTGFIIAYPGNWKLKCIYIALGSVLIYFINLIRIQILLFHSIFYPESLEFNHKYTYTIVVYSCIFGLWMLWSNYLSLKKNFTLLKPHVSQ